MDSMPASREERFALGMTFGNRYLLKRKLGQGGAATVFAAEHVTTKRTIALKLPHTDPELKDALFARLGRELRALSMVRHPAIVDLVDGGELEGIPFIAMPLLEGRTLSSLIAARGTLTVNATVKLGIELAEGLAAVHAAGIIHRDVKPSNVMVTRNPGNQVRLVDFGTAKLKEGQETEPQLTRAGAILGTLEYMAPESLLSLSAADHRVDIYALGVTLYECLSGSVPFEGSMGQILMRLTQAKPPSVGSVRPDAPKELSDVVERCLRRDASDRFGSMEDVVSALESCAADRAVDVLGDARGPLGAERAEAERAEPEKAPSRMSGGVESRREYQRAQYITLARVSRLEGRWIDGRIEDVSEGGVLFVSTEACVSGEAVRLRFASPISGRVADVAARVRWSRSSRGLHATGFEFENLHEQVRAEIRQYVAFIGKR